MAEVTVQVEPFEVQGLDAFLTGAAPDPLHRVTLVLVWLAWSTAEIIDPTFEQLMAHIRKQRHSFQQRANEQVAAEATEGVE